MTKITVGMNGPFGEIKNKAYWAARSIDSQIFEPWFKNCNYKNFLQVKSKNPTAADIAFWEALRKNKVFSDQYIKGSIERFENQDGISNMAKSMRERNKKLYPKTLEMRQTLLENNRFSLDQVKPKLSKLEKLLFVIEKVIDKYYNWHN